MVNELQRVVARDGGELGRQEVEVIATDLVDFLVGGLAAPSLATEPPAIRSSTARARARSR